MNCSFDTFLWSGANSIFHRREAAKRLALQLENNVRRSPNIQQVVIAHSHGGNVTARALGYLDSNISDLRVCYLATPFLELFPRELEKEERFLLSAMATFLLFFVGLIPFEILVARIQNFIYGSVGQSNDWTFNILLFFSIMAGRAVYLWTASKRSRALNEELIQATTAAKHDRPHRDSLILRAICSVSARAMVPVLAGIPRAANSVSPWWTERSRARGISTSGMALGCDCGDGRPTGEWVGQILDGIVGFVREWGGQRAPYKLREARMMAMEARALAAPAVDPRKSARPVAAAAMKAATHRRRAPL